MKSPLRVLNIEDSIRDSELLRRPFEAAGYDIVWERAENAEEFRQALARESWDVVLADNNMPQFDAAAALRIFQQQALDIPFIVVSGAIGEDLGISMMRAGAHDYVLKHQARRLVPAVERELRETQVRRERRAALDRLRESEQRFRQLAEVTPHLVWQTGAEGQPEYANSRCREYFGREAADFPPEQWKDVIHPEDLAAAGAVNSDPDRPRPQGVEIRLRRHDGTYHWFIQRSVAVRDPDGRIQHWVHTATDIDNLKQHAEALVRTNAQLQQFAYAAAHDLLEPLRNVSTSLRLLERLYQQHPDKEALELIAEATGDAHRLHRMLSGLYEITKIDAADSAGAVADGAQVMRQVLANLRTAIAESNAEVTAAMLPSVPIREVHLLQLLQNLVANSLKFRDPARPLRVRLSAERQSRHWLFSVADNGIGFEPSQSQRLFDLFRRLHQDQEGTGVGLALCARIVSSYGGRIWAEGRPGEGATFFFTLPIREATEKDRGVPHS